MVTCNRLTLSFALGFLLLCSLDPHGASVSAISQDDGDIDAFSAGGRHLHQLLTPCPHQWAYDNFTNLEINCPYVVNVTVDYPKKQCCNALLEMICPYAVYVNDGNSACARDFFSTLKLVAPNYTDNFFGFICTDTSQTQLECPANFTAGAPAPSSSPSQGSHSFVVTILLALAVLEILVLLF